MDELALTRFEAKITRDPETNCWKFATLDAYGYGQFHYNKKTVKAHRLAYIQWKGPIADGLYVRHLCKGKCVNPDHLELGTHKQNQADMIRDGTSTRGEKHGNSKLTAEQVLEIRRRYDENQRVLAEEFGISQQNISDIIAKRRWAWLD